MLIVLHVNHTDEKRIDSSDARILGEWRRQGILYTSPHGMNDDWYWLHAGVVSGSACKVISNDEMRDHHFGMLSPKYFLRWKERHVLHFNVEAVEGAPPKPRLLDPLPYSHTMQVNDAGVWHVPLQAEVPERWLCLHSSDEEDKI